MGNWKTAFKSMSSCERMCLVEAERKAQSLFLQEVAGAMCALHPLGIVDCSDLEARAVVSKWTRVRGTIFVQITATANRPGARRTFKWNLRPMLAKCKRPKSPRK